MIHIDMVAFKVYKFSGPSCSKLTMSLVNVSLKLTIKYGINAYIFAEKNTNSFCIDLQKLLRSFSKNTCKLDIVLTRTVNYWTSNKLVKL